jgi:hypothetical protein
MLTKRIGKLIFVLTLTAASAANAADESSRKLCDQTPSVEMDGEGKFLFCSSDGRVSFFETDRGGFYAVDNTFGVGRLSLYPQQNQFSSVISVELQLMDGTEYFAILHEDKKYDIVRTIDSFIHEAAGPAGCGFHCL